MGLRKASILLLVIAALMLLPVVLNDPMDEETALFRGGHKDGRSATTQEMLDARETWSPPYIQYGWMGGSLVLAAAGGVGLFLSRRKQS